MGKWLIAIAVVLFAAGAARADAAPARDVGVTTSSAGDAALREHHHHTKCGTGLVAILLVGFGLFIAAIVGLLYAFVRAIIGPRHDCDEVPQPLSLLTVDALAAAIRQRYALGMVFAAASGAALFARLPEPVVFVFPGLCFLVGLAGWLRTRRIQRLLALPNAAADRMGRIIVVRNGDDAVTFASSDRAIRRARRSALPRSIVA